jgi:hypothetical protein
VEAVVSSFFSLLQLNKNAEIKTPKRNFFIMFCF